jgi:multidrug efflux pump
MRLSELSVRRPVFATVLSLLLLILGLMAALSLPVREYPNVDRPIVSIETNYRGASADVIETRVTQVLEEQVAGLEGVEKVTSSSRDETSSISIEFSVDRDLDGAANDVRERISRVLARLPEEVQAPQISKVDDGAEPVMYINVSSTGRNSLELSDYVRRILRDRFSSVPGVASVRIGGERRFAMRVWLQRESLAARALTVNDVENALRAENVELPAGRLESRQREFTLRTDTNLRTEDDFRNLVIGRSPDGYLVRLGEVAQVRLAAENERSIARSNGLPGVSLGIIPQSQANVLEISRLVQEELARVQPGLPADMKAEVNLDFSVFIAESIRKVIYAVGETLAIVLLVIFLFLGTLRATLIPAVTIPISIVAAALVMTALGFSINTLTLLAAVLAIGLVVDDAIVVLENIVRRMEAGEAALVAAINGSREIGFAVVATTLVLMAVFVPVSFMGGNLGRLFGEFGITVAAAVGFSALIALTLTPMMTSKLFAKGMPRGRLAQSVDKLFHDIDDRYAARLRTALRGQRPVAIVGGALALTTVVVALTYFGWPMKFMQVNQEFAPKEDRAMIPVLITAPEGSSLAYLDRYLTDIEAMLQDEVARGNVRRIISRTGGWGRAGEVSAGTLFMPLELWDQRADSSSVIAQRTRQRLQNIAGVRIVVIEPPSLGGRGGGRPLQLVIGGGEFRELAEWRDKIIARVSAENPRILAMDSNYQERKPQLAIQIDRNKAADLGVSLSAVGRTLETMLGSRVVTTFVRSGEEYNVLLQAREDERASVNDLDNMYVRSSSSGELIPMSALVRVEERAGPNELRRFDQLRSITLSANLAPGYTLGEALDYVEGVVRSEAPSAQINYDGESRELKQSGALLWITFAFALLIVYLLLAAQFESFVHPIVILITVPLALTGALLGLWLFNSSINVFSQIGAIMLIGIACKNGILIVEFANQLRDRGIEFGEAIVQAAAVRLRPVLMTSLCTAFGAVPLMIATGAGAESRQSIGAAVFFGTIFSLVLTLYVVPALYWLIARNTRSPEYVSRLIEKLLVSAPATSDVRAVTAETK